jgi:hypothetical protein
MVAWQASVAHECDPLERWDTLWAYARLGDSVESHCMTAVGGHIERSRVALL